MDTPSKPKPIRITQVSYGRTVALPNYCNVKFELTADVSQDEDWRDVLDNLKRKAAKIRDQTLAEEG